MVLPLRQQPARRRHEICCDGLESSGSSSWLSPPRARAGSGRRSAKTWGGGAADARAQSSRSCAQSSADLAASVDLPPDVLDRVRLKGTVLFHYEFGRPWSVALPRSPDAIFHYLSRGSASIALAKGPAIQMTEGDFVLIVRGEAHVLRSGRKTKPVA